jgi:hypothetical protein
VTLALGALVAAFMLPAAAPGAPVVSLSASPARLALAGDGAAVVALRNVGRSSVSVTAGSAGVALDLRGRPALTARAARRSAAAWLSVRPRRLSLAPGGAAFVKVASLVPARAEPGDHHALVLFSTQATQAGSVGVRMRVGVRVVVRAPGTIIRRLVIRRLHVRRRGRARLLVVGLANLGNITETLLPGRVTVSLLARGRVVVRVRTQRRELLPHSFGIAAGTYVGPLRGRVLARVETRGAGRRLFWIRL